MGLFSKIGAGLRKTRESLLGTVNSMLRSFARIDEELFEELEEILVTGDVGVRTAQSICNDLRSKVKERGITDPAEIRGLLRETVAQLLQGGQELGIGTSPSVILVIGVNGVGKTTTIGKMAARLKAEGKKVILLLQSATVARSFAERAVRIYETHKEHQRSVDEKSRRAHEDAYRASIEASKANARCNRRASSHGGYGYFGRR